MIARATIIISSAALAGTSAFLIGISALIVLRKWGRSPVTNGRALLT
jgi:hypothetical protein